MPRPYDTVDAEQLQRDAESCMLSYGTTFHPEIITSADGIFIETASGQRIMDVRVAMVWMKCAFSLTQCSSLQAVKCLH